MAYIDSFVVPVRTDQMEIYRAMAAVSRAVWCEHGALDYRECVADDVKSGVLTSFPQSVLLQPGETVVLAYVVFQSRAHRDEVNAKAMADPRIQSMMDPAHRPFDAQRMFFGGFDTLVGS